MYDRNGRNLGALKYFYKSNLYQWYLQRVCNMSTYDRPLTGYTHAPRSRREMLTTSSLCYQPPPPASYRARTAGATDRAALLSSNGVSEYIVIMLLPHRSTLPSQIRQPHNGRVRYKYQHRYAVTDGLPIPSKWVIGVDITHLKNFFCVSECALSTYSHPTRAFSADQSYNIKVTYCKYRV